MLKQTVMTTGLAGGLIRPCKGLIPASAPRALKNGDMHPMPSDR